MLAYSLDPEVYVRAEAILEAIVWMTDGEDIPTAIELVYLGSLENWAAAVGDVDAIASCWALHQLRHTFGTEMTRRAHGNLVAVAAAMGHESTNTTMGYVGWSGDSAAIIASMFGGSDAA